MKSTLAHWTEHFENLEKLVIEGRHNQVKQALGDVNLKQIPKSLLASYGELACRISEPIISLKLLNKTVFPENEFADAASDKEKFIYATALGNLGAVDEAIEIFNSIDAKNEPEVFLRKAMAHFRAWNYPAAIPLLQDFLNDANLAPYRKVIGQVNLIAALVIENRFDEAMTLISEVQSVCTANNYLLLLGNTFELQGQIEFFRKNYDQAKTLLEKSMQLLKNQDGEFYLFAEKWKLICDAFQHNDTKSIKALKEYRLKVSDLGQHETVRDCDLLEAVLTKDEDLFRKVILGTPSEYYRQRARRLFGKTISLHGNFYLELGSFADAPTSFDFNPYEVQNGHEGLYTKPQLLALFEALTVDFYKPSYIGLLFQRIYKNEKFNPFTSPKRVLSLMKRLNLWFQAQNVPLQVKLKKSEFQLVARENASVKILVQRTKTLSKQQGQLFSLKQYFKDRTFSAESVSQKMDISKTSAQNLILQAIENGQVIKMGNGRGTTYALALKNKKRAAA